MPTPASFWEKQGKQAYIMVTEVGIIWILWERSNILRIARLTTYDSCALSLWSGLQVMLSKALPNHCFHSPVLCALLCMITLLHLYAVLP